MDYLDTQNRYPLYQILIMQLEESLESKDIKFF